MATKVHMEALSPTMEEGQVVKWLKSEGDDVTSGEIIAEIETDKATMELIARGDGILRAILVGEGGTAPVGEVIALIGAADEDISELQAAALAGKRGEGTHIGEAGVVPSHAGQQALHASSSRDGVATGGALAPDPERIGGRRIHDQCMSPDPLVELTVDLTVATAILNRKTHPLR